MGLFESDGGKALTKILELITFPKLFIFEVEKLALKIKDDIGIAILVIRLLAQPDTDIAIKFRMIFREFIRLDCLPKNSLLCDFRIVMGHFEELQQFFLHFIKDANDVKSRKNPHDQN